MKLEEQKQKAEIAKLHAETRKIMAETAKIEAETKKIQRDTKWYFLLILTTITAIIAKGGEIIQNLFK